MDEREYRRLVASNFYRAFCPHRMDELEYIDYNYPVRDVRIEKDTELWGFKDPRLSPFMTTFFCNPGTPRQILGVHGVGNLKTHPKPMEKVLNKYKVLLPIPHALWSLCASG